MSDIKKIVFGGGCFWCTEAIFSEVEGVIDVKSGYSGGATINPTYREVCDGRTGHAEVVEITYDAQKVPLALLLVIHLTTHNPTTLNKQGADHGTQYRSIIFYENDAEKQIAENAIKEVQEAFDDLIVTEVKPIEEFYIAEVSHQEYYKNNPNAGYCQAVIAPKLAKFRMLYQQIKKVN